MTHTRTLRYIVIVVGLIIVGSLIFSQPTPSTRVTNETSSSTSTPEEISSPSISSYQSGQLVDVGGSTYRFASMDWVFADAGVNRTGVPLTTVRVQFDRFVRNGVAIDVLPYRLGTYEGVCSPVETISATLPSGARPLASARCFWQGKGKEFIVFQNGQNVTTQYRTIGDTALTVPFKQLLTIDVTTVVQD